MLLKCRYFITVTIAVLMYLLSITTSDAYSIYFNDFNSSVGTEWSTGVPVDRVVKPNGHYDGQFLGQFSGNDSTTLSLTGLLHGLVTLSFDTYFLRSWDGNDNTSGYGPDTFEVSAGEVNLLSATFSNGNPAGQSYIGTPSTWYPNAQNTSMSGSLQQYSLGYDFYNGITKTTQGMDSVYHFDFTFFNSYDSLQFTFAGRNLQNNIVTGSGGESLGYLDESWGIDNVNVDVTPVPEPSSIFLFSVGGLGLLALYKRKRRKDC